MNQLPEFPWDRLAPFAAQARAHPGGVVDLSVGTPVDPTPAVVRRALELASDAPGYPAAAGSPALLAAARDWLRRRTGAPADIAVAPTIGSKELVALLPWLLGVRTGVSVPALAYPTYSVGAALAGVPSIIRDDAAQTPPAHGLTWLNSPANPSGEVLGVAELRAALSRARSVGAVLASDECYLELGWEAEPVSVLDPAVNDGDLTGLLAVHSLSKRSNLAGYRLGLVSGDPALVGRLVEVRRHAGLLVPAPVQAAGVAAFGDDEHVAVTRACYAARRTRLRVALTAYGLQVAPSPAGLYLWCTAGESCWVTVERLAAAGILVAPGEFYGAAGERHVRVALTATDERVAAACERLSA